MYLKSIELSGFKSFAHRTEILFDQGITAIVGPNGCGKSNIVDAVKWVLGTLSRKSIRGEEMLDVVFHGAEGIGPSGLAEVSITLSNKDHILPIEYEEVRLTRRIYRSGESEFMINKNPCKLRDIRELLYGTGIGQDSYSIIEQGSIDRLITADACELRFIFDEAAGISRYRAKKRETELRLEKVESDLLRVKDLLIELSSQIRSLRSQASRAERYKRLYEQLKTKKFQLNLKQYQSLFGHQRELANYIHQLDSRREGLQKDIQALESELSSAQEKLGLLDERLRDLELSYTQVEVKIKAKQDERDLVMDQLQQYALELNRLQEEKRGLESRDQVIEKETENYLERIKLLEASIVHDLEHIDTLKANLQEALTDSLKTQQLLDHERDRLMDMVSEQTRLKNQLIQLESEIGSLTADFDKLILKQRQYEARLEQIRGQLGQKDQTVRGIQAQLEGLRKDLQDKELYLREISSRLVELEKGAQTLQELCTQRASRRKFLQELMDGYEGIHPGARWLASEGKKQLPGIIGIVSDLLEIQYPYTKAIEAILGEKASYLVVKDTQTLISVLELIKLHSMETVPVICLEYCKVQRKEQVLPSGLRPAREFVNTSPEYHQLLEVLLGDAAVADSDRDPLEVLLCCNIFGSVGFLSGDLIEPPGIVIFGADHGRGILSRKAELIRLGHEVEQDTLSLQRYKEEIAGLKERVNLVSSDIKMIGEQIYRKEVQRIEALHTQQELLHQEKDTQSELIQVYAELGIIQLQIEYSKGEANLLSKRLEDLTSQIADTEHKIRDLTHARERFLADQDRLRDQLFYLKAGLIEKIERREAQIQGLYLLDEESVGMVKRLKGVKGAIGGLLSRVSQAEKQVQQNQDSITTLCSERDGLIRDLDLSKSERDRLLRLIEGLKDRLLSIRHQREEIETAIHQKDLEFREAQAQLELILEHLREEFGIKPDQISLEPLDTPTQVLESEIQTLRQQLDSLGNVNLVALDRIKELEQRYQFLRSQQEDLMRTKERLKEMISKVNKESLDQFHQTLEVTRRYFNEFFRKLFGGGKADVVLQDPSEGDPFSAGIQVAVRLPQKEATTLSLLSGGEKSLTAIALIMALFKTHPSPFCILDEADATLDETNTAKFISLIHEFTKATQFIIITHNKRTMAMADVLYGITMEQPGISKKISITLSDIDQQLKAIKEGYNLTGIRT